MTESGMGAVLQVSTSAGGVPKRPVPAAFVGVQGLTGDGHNEPPHVHVDRGDQSAKFWLAPVGLARNLGFSAHELKRVEALIQANEQQLLEAWRGYFGA